MSQKTLLVAFALLLVGAGTWFATRTDNAPAPENDSAQNPGQRQQAHAEQVASAGVADADTESVDNVRVAVSTRESLLPLPDDVEWTEVRIVDKQTAQTIEGADVYWFDKTVGDATTERKLFRLNDATLWRDPEQLAVRYGWHTRSNADGVARIHRANGTKVFGRAGDRFGTVACGKELVEPATGFELALDGDVGFDVQVVDASGEPVAGIPVMIALFDRELTFLEAFGGDAYTMTYGDDGRARIGHTQQLPQRKEEDGKHYRVCVCLPGVFDPGVRFEPLTPPDETIVLQLPPTGRIKARAEVGGKVAPLGFFSLRSQDSQDDRRSMGRWRGVAQPGDGGWARFENVPLGQRFRIEAYVNGNALKNEFQGPSTVDAEVDVVLEPDRDAMLVVGRLVDDDRRPLVDCSFDLTVRGDVGHFRTHKTDEQGRFLIVLSNEANKSVDNKFEFEVAPAGQPKRSVESGPHPLHVGVQDIGDVVVEVSELILAGTCTIDGKPGKLQDAFVDREMTWSDGRSHWSRAGEVRLVARDDGTFEFRGGVRQTRLRLNLGEVAYQAIEPIVFPRGKADLKIELRSGVPLAVTMLAPSFEWQTVQAALHPVASDGKPIEGAVKAREGERQQVDWTALPAGTFELQFTLPGFAAPIATVPDVVIPQPDGGDPRLVDIDLRDLVRKQVVNLFDDVGEPLKRNKGAIVPLGQGDSGDVAGFPTWAATSEFLLPARGAQVLVAVSRFRPQTVHCIEDAVDVHLVPWPIVTVTLPDDVELPEGAKLWLRLERPTDDKRQWRAPWRTGYVSELYGPPVGVVAFRNGELKLSVGDEPRRLVLRLDYERESVTVKIPVQTLSLATTAYELRVDNAAVRQAFDAAKKLAEKNK